jgi:hypothetical protein
LLPLFILYKIPQHFFVVEIQKKTTLPLFQFFLRV